MPSTHWGRHPVPDTSGPPRERPSYVPQTRALYWIELVSCAKKATAFFRISRSSRKIRFSWRSRRNSSCSSLGNPS